MTQLLLVRHGETEWNAARRIQGQTESRLTERGRRQADALAARLADVPLAAIYASDLSRALDTASPLARARGLEVRPRAALREKDFGAWEGLTPEEVESRFPGAWRQYHARREWDYPIPGGETWPEVQIRVLADVREILAAHPGPTDTVLIVSHGGSLKMLILDALDAPVSSVTRLRLDNASLCIAEYPSPDLGRIISLNDTSHLEAL